MGHTKKNLLTCGLHPFLSGMAHIIIIKSLEFRMKAFINYKQYHWVTKCSILWKSCTSTIIIILVRLFVKQILFI